MKPNRLALYHDVREVLDQVLANDGGSYTLATPGQILHWRQRCYKFRKEYAKVFGTCPYDVLTFPTPPEGSCTAEIRVNRPAGLFLPAKRQGPVDELDAAAEALARKLNNGDVV